MTTLLLAFPQHDVETQEITLQASKPKLVNEQEVKAQETS